jgi:hypothetical protein
MKIPKSIVIFFIVVIALLIVVGLVWVGIGIATGGYSSQGALSPYSAVYLTTGDIYFGKLDWSPSPHMEDAWFLQRSTDAKGNVAVGVYPFSQVEWGPSKDVYFNTQQIVFWTRLNSTSSIAQLIANPSAMEAAAAAQNTGMPQISGNSQSANNNQNLPTAPSTSTPTH